MILISKGRGKECQIHCHAVMTVSEGHIALQLSQNRVRAEVIIWPSSCPLWKPIQSLSKSLFQNPSMVSFYFFAVAVFEISSFFIANGIPVYTKKSDDRIFVIMLITQLVVVLTVLMNKLGTCCDWWDREGTNNALLLTQGMVPIL